MYKNTAKHARKIVHKSNIVLHILKTKREWPVRLCLPISTAQWTVYLFSVISESNCDISGLSVMGRKNNLESIMIRYHDYKWQSPSWVRHLMYFLR
jgi:hypothetical protein